MTLGLYCLPQVAPSDQILGSPVNPTVISTSFVLLCIPQKINTDTYTSSVGENTFASQINNS